MVVADSKQTRARSEFITYPEGDGKPMAETESHVLVITGSIAALRHFFANRDDVYVIGNSFIYYEQGDPKKRLAPDVYVVFGVEKRIRDSYFVWEEGDKYPDLIIEVTSRSTRNEDIRTKRSRYEQWGVREYILFDPKAEYLSPPLQGLRLVNGAYVPIPMQDNHLPSEVLGLDFVAVVHQLRLRDPITGEFLPTLDEAVDQARLEQERARLEQERAENAEAENQQLRAELEALRKQLAAQDETPGS
jgi:Uma2 family endonuclease